MSEKYKVIDSTIPPVRLNKPRCKRAPKCKGRPISKTISVSKNTLSELKGLGFTDDIATKIVAKNKSLNLSETEVKTLMQDLKTILL